MSDFFITGMLFLIASYVTKGFTSYLWAIFALLTFILSLMEKYA